MESRGNNFKRLEEEELIENQDAIRKFEEEHDERILNSVWGTLGFFRMVGDVVDVYLAKVVDVLIDASGFREDGGGAINRMTASETEDDHRPPSDPNSTPGPDTDGPDRPV